MRINILQQLSLDSNWKPTYYLKFEEKNKYLEIIGVTTSGEQITLCDVSYNYVAKQWRGNGYRVGASGIKTIWRPR